MRIETLVEGYFLRSWAAGLVKYGVGAGDSCKYLEILHGIVVYKRVGSIIVVTVCDVTVYRRVGVLNCLLGFKWRRNYG